MKNKILTLVISASIFSINPSVGMEAVLEEQPQFQLPRKRQDHFQYLQDIGTKRPIRILSLDGGGIRGLLELIWLQEIQKETNLLCTDLFDVFVGTSTGGIIAAGLAAGAPLKELMSYYSGAYKDDIFSKKLSETYEKHIVTNALNGIVNSHVPFFKDKVKSLYSGLFSPRYCAQGAESVYKEAFGDSVLSNLHKPAFVTATKLCPNGTYKFHMFDSIKAQQDPNHDQKLWEVLRATSAAPTYFPPMELEVNGKKETFVDGGIMCNNPSLKGYFLIKSYFPNAQYELFSLSTGQFYNANEHNHGHGAFGWAESIINATMQSQSDTANEVLKMSLGDNYYRLHSKALDNESSQMDNILQNNINKLIELAKEEITRSQFKRIINTLQNVNDKNITEGVYTIKNHFIRSQLNSTSQHPEIGMLSCSRKETSPSGYYGEVLRDKGKYYSADDLKDKNGDHFLWKISKAEEGGMYTIKNNSHDDGGWLTWVDNQTYSGYYTQILANNGNNGSYFYPNYYPIEKDKYYLNGRYSKDVLWKIFRVENGKYIIKNMGDTFNGSNIGLLCYTDKASNDGQYAQVLHSFKGSHYDAYRDKYNPEGEFSDSILWELSLDEEASKEL